MNEYNRFKSTNRISSTELDYHRVSVHPLNIK